MPRSSRRSKLLPRGVSVAPFGADRGFDAAGIPTPAVGVSVAVEVRVAVAVHTRATAREEGAAKTAGDDDLRGALSAVEGSFTGLEAGPTGVSRVGI